MNNIISFASDYLEGTNIEIINKLLETNMEQTVGYGLDEYSISEKIKLD